MFQCNKHLKSFFNLTGVILKIKKRHLPYVLKKTLASKVFCDVIIKKV